MLKYHEKIETATTKMGAEFKDYRPETGAWTFVVRFALLSLFLVSNRNFPCWSRFFDSWWQWPHWLNKRKHFFIHFDGLKCMIFA